MDEKDKIIETPDELKAEEESLKEVPEADLQTKIAEDMGLDPEVDADLITKLVEREKAHRKELSKTISQKIKYREQAKKLPVKKDEKEQPNVSELVANTVRETLEARGLETISATDEIKTEIKELAKLKGISVREAAKLPYIVSRIQEVEKEKRVENAIPRRNDKGAKIYVDPSKPLDPKDFKLDTPEGREDWKAAKEARRKHERGS